MSTYRYLIPIETLKRLEPWLQENIGYERCLLHHEFEAILEATLTTLKLDDEEKQLYLAQDIKLTVDQCKAIGLNENEEYFVIDQEQRYEYAMNIGANIVMYCEFDNNGGNRQKANKNDNMPQCRLNNETIETLLKDTYNKAKKYYNNANADFSINDIYYILILLTGLYYKCKSSSFYHLSFLNTIPIAEQEDIFRLYQFLHDCIANKKKIPKVSIVCNNQQLLINNKYNWFINVLNEYLEKRIKLKQFKKEDRFRYAQEAYQKFKQIYPKVPGRPNDEIFNTLLLSLYRLTLILPMVKFPHQSITYIQVDFIIEYLKYLGLSISSDLEKRKNLRSKIKYLIEHNKKPCWLDFSTYRQVSNDEAFIC